MHDMQCMLVTSPNTLLIGGHHTRVIELDLATVKEKQQVLDNYTTTQSIYNRTEQNFIRHNLYN